MLSLIINDLLIPKYAILYFEISNCLIINKTAYPRASGRRYLIVPRLPKPAVQGLPWLLVQPILEGGCTLAADHYFRVLVVSQVYQ